MRQLDQLSGSVDPMRMELLVLQEAGLSLKFHVVGLVYTHDYDNFIAFRVLGRTIYVRLGFGIGFICCVSFGCSFEIRMILINEFHRLDIVVFKTILFIVSLSVLVLEGLQQTFSDRLYRGIYGVSEILRVVRRFCLMVAEDSTVPESYELYRWTSFELGSLRLSAGKESLIFKTFASHRSRYTCGGEFQHAVTVVEEFIITIAMNLLRLPPVSDRTNMALACWGPDMLMHANISEMEEIMGCYLETLERRGRLVATDKTPMLESFVRFNRQFRDDHHLETHESELWQYGSEDVVLCRLMQISFCVSGSFNRVYNFVDFSLPQLSSENMSSMIRTILSWCQSRGVRSLQSIPDGLVAESIDAVGRAIDAPD